MDEAIDRILNSIERIEMHSLVWGDVDASLNRKEALRIAAEHVGADRSEDAVERLVEQRLVYEIRTGVERHYRSRFAELVRLLVRLRQIFDGEDWRGAPRLVSDFRVDCQPRRFPRRDIDATAAWTALCSGRRFAPVQEKVWQMLTTDSEGGLVRLSGFQLRSLCRIVEAPGDSGTIVTAGTGSGKTLAFYLPAILHLAPLIERRAFWTKVLAIYPRRELLKDQLTETLRQAVKLNDLLMNRVRRPLRVGAIYGEIPNTPRAGDAELNGKGWQVGRDGVVCPLVRCPRCDGTLLWRTEDRTSGRERLVCAAGDCGFAISGEMFPLTRQAVQNQPPDILLTTAEMLNRRMADGRSRHLFGLDQPARRRPKLVLLDEVHTYTGTQGAQTALLLRRWRHLVGAPVAFVGLSATLREAPRFFQELAGTAPDRTVEITPDLDELIESGAEYQVALRGDPVSQAALLSASIQAVMALGRCLDPPDGTLSDNLYGSRTFVFTDDLDVTHRLYDDLHDAEAYTRFRRPDHTRRPLATLRASGGPDDTERDADGQLWRLPERLGRNLEHRLRLGRTTSRDPGVVANTDVIVATAALEVGFNDPSVGAILQHKAPHSAAAFVQRRGRAGRPRNMRPITVTVLSDYGRDRRAFQSYEHLFDAHLPAQRLAIKNQYILRMQASFALIDWLLEQCPLGERGAWLYAILSGPTSAIRPGSAEQRKVLQHVRRTITDLVRGKPETLESLCLFLRKALHLDSEEVDVLLWEPPRALLLEVVPTLARRIFRDWRKAFPDHLGKYEYFVEFHPLPEFLPSSLFSDLNLPEVGVVIPPATRGSAEKSESLPIGAALGRLVPGRVTRRFADEYGGLAHWVPVNPDTSTMNLTVENYARRYEYVGHFRVGDERTSVALPVFRPLEIELARVTENEALPTSNARFMWVSQFTSRGEPVELKLPRRTAWSDLEPAVKFWLHKQNASVAVCRFTQHAIANVRRRGSDEAIVDVRLVDREGRPAAVGFEIDVDGLALDLDLRDVLDGATNSMPDGLRVAVRTGFYRDSVKDDPRLDRSINEFERDWLQQVFLSAALVRAERDRTTLAEAASLLKAEGLVDSYQEVTDAIFAIQEAQAATDGEDEVYEDDNDSLGEDRQRRRSRFGRLKRRLLNLLGEPAVVESLATAVEKAFNLADPPWSDWLRGTLERTLASALSGAAVQVAPREVALDTLVADYETTASGLRLWLTESTLGGAGVIEALAEQFAGEPRSLFQALEAAIAPGDLELAVEDLGRIVTLAVDDAQVASRMAEIRAASGHRARAEARQRLTGELARHGVLVGHALAVSMSARLFRPGTSQDTDVLLRDLLQRWDAIEARHGAMIGLREYAYVAATQHDDVSERLHRIGLVEVDAPAARLVQVLSGFLWPRPAEIRCSGLQAYNPYRERGFIDPAMVRMLLFESMPPMVSLDNPDWQKAAIDTLADYGTVRLVVKIGAERLLRSAMLEFLGTPIDVGVLQFYALAERVDRADNTHTVTMVLRETMG